MKRIFCAALATIGLAASPDDLTARFDARLSPDQKARHAISRLTFGARPGDLEEVRRMGLEKWIDLQLHPDRIPENAALEESLKPLTTLRLAPAELLAKYFPQFAPGVVQFPRITDFVSQDQIRKIYNGTAEQRSAALMALDPETRIKVLPLISTDSLEGLPDLQKQQTEARKIQNEERMKEMRKLRPPLNELLEPEQMRIATRGTPAERAALFASLESAKLERVALALPQDALVGRPDLRRTVNMSRSPRDVVIGDLREGKLYRAIQSNRQLEEVLADFWFNHFNVFEGKDREERALLAAYERDAIRPHVLGKFKDLLLATARHPAMLRYLDNWMSMSTDVYQIGPFAPAAFTPPNFALRQPHGLNENYGRELLELHTLGVNGGYTQQDVIEVARCFTGWTIRKPNDAPEFLYASFMHDPGEKIVLGHRIPAGGGEQDGLQVIELLARHPATARFLSTKLARRFVADDPPPSIVDCMASAFLKSGGDLRAVMTAMLTSREFFSEGAWQAKIKSPLEMVASAARALDARPSDSYMLVQKAAEMGQPLYGKESPNGYRDASDAWLSTANVMARVGFANAMANGRIPGLAVDLTRFAGKDAAAIARELLDGEPSAQTLAALEGQTDAARVAGLLIGSPEFQRR